jgi:stage II sporulation protein D
MTRRHAIKLLVSGTAALAVLFNAARRSEPIPAQAASRSPAIRETIRVGVWTLRHDREVTLSPLGNAGGSKLRRCAGCAAITLSKPTDVRANGNALKVTRIGKADQANRIWVDGGVGLAAHGEKLTMVYPMSISARNGVLIIVSSVPVESYVERVVASESSAEDSIESLKALAIVVRTFALHETHGHVDYDLCDSTHCQLLRWSGGMRTTAAAHRATLATAGETLWYRGLRALGYFAKDCGGQTASPAEIWPKASKVAYLTSRPDRFCSADGAHGWASEITQSELTSALGARGVAPPGWQSLSIGRRGVSGRAATILLDRREIAAEDFRLAVGESLGWNRMPSTWFEVSRQGDRYFFHGRGWGHGVGLCQKGATSMAEQGMGETQILEQYFPGARASDEESGRSWRRFSGSGFELESLDPADAEFVPEISRARAEASNLSGLNSSKPFTIRAFPGTAEFRAETLAPGWVAAFSEGDWIATQPLRTLASRHLLASTIRHEFLHALVEGNAGPAAPLWLREGLVEAWSNKRENHGTSVGESLNPSALEAKLAHPRVSRNQQRLIIWQVNMYQCYSSDTAA